MKQAEAPPASFFPGGPVNHSTGKLTQALVISFLTFAPGFARADGLLEGMADGINDTVTYVSEGASNLGDRIEENVKPAASNFTHSVRKVTSRVFGGISKIADKAKRKIDPDESEK